MNGRFIRQIYIGTHICICPYIFGKTKILRNERFQLNQHSFVVSLVGMGKHEKKSLKSLGIPHTYLHDVCVCMCDTKLNITTRRTNPNKPHKSITSFRCVGVRAHLFVVRNFITPRSPRANCACCKRTYLYCHGR